MQIISCKLHTSFVDFDSIQGDGRTGQRGNDEVFAHVQLTCTAAARFYAAAGEAGTGSSAASTATFTPTKVQLKQLVKQIFLKLQQQLKKLLE